MDRSGCVVVEKEVYSFPVMSEIVLDLSSHNRADVDCPTIGLKSKQRLMQAEHDRVWRWG